MSIKNNLQTILPQIHAVIFDMDGVLVDSEGQHFRAHKLALRSFGVNLNKRLYKFHGVSNDPLEFYKIAIGRKSVNENLLSLVHQSKNRYFNQLQKRQGVKGAKDAIALAEFLHSKKIPLAVATNLDFENASRMLKILAIDSLFEHIVSADFMQKKPAPDVYLRAVKLLNIPAHHCLAIEDSGPGVASAVAAGLRCIAVPSELTKLHNFKDAIAISTCKEILLEFRNL